MPPICSTLFSPAFDREIFKGISESLDSLSEREFRNQSCWLRDCNESYEETALTSTALKLQAWVERRHAAMG
jgi:hypothetical protein